MIYVRLWGGLGNQLFQYAFGYSMAKRNNTTLVLDTTFYTDNYLNQNPRFTKQKPYILESNLQYKAVNIDLAEKRKIDFLQRKTLNRLIRIPQHFSIKIGNNVRYIKETRAVFDEYLLQTYKEDTYYDGYWQCEEYFADYREELIPQLTPICDISKYQDLFDEILKGNSVALHIRRGDYSQNKMNIGNLHILPMEYYERAIEKISITVENPKFYVFSNDIEAVKTYFKNRSDFVYVSGMPDIETTDEFYLMSRCKHQIIGNSTFSWWAAWLNSYEDKRVYAPNQWFGNHDIIPDAWIKIAFDE